MIGDPVTLKAANEGEVWDPIFEILGTPAEHELALGKEDELNYNKVIVDTDEENTEPESESELGPEPGTALRENGSKRPYTKKETEGKRKRMAGFTEWLSKKTKVWKEESETSSKDDPLDDERMSARALIHNASQNITEPREYQLELFEIAKQMNCLAVLDTGYEGSGKTLIACLLIRHMVSEELEARARGERRRVSFFLVDSVTLVFQQTAVLSCNIDAKIGKYCGDMCTKLWNQESWTKILADHLVVVMTADVLANCLTHSFIKMQDINLLCFDEAHHAKKNHVYARIIKDFYLPEPEGKRPKIFGMTASPVDARVDVVTAATELETLMHSRIVTTSDLTLLQGSLRRPEEKIMPYSPLEAPFETELCKTLRNKYGSISAIGQVFRFAGNASAQLGSWCADRVWTFALSEVEAHKMERRAERTLNQQVTKEDIALMEKEIVKVREVRKFMASYAFPEPKFALEDTSSKVLMLRTFLQRTYHDSDSEKCIIFVQRRYTARCLYALLKDNVSGHMKLGILVGSRNGMVGEENFSFRQQMLNVSRFRRGKLNCLIATSVAEEGLDIPDCSLVVRFDLYTTMIQYIQSRGRARHSKSKYYHMIERGNADHIKILKDVRGAENIMRLFCQSLPEDRLMDESQSSQLLDETLENVYVEPTTGAKLTYASSMQVISHYVGNLPQEGDDIAQATYVVRPTGLKTYICELILPSVSPLATFESPAMNSKATAKRAAAFEACIQLRKGGHLNEYLLPKFRLKDRPKYANARLAVDINKTNTYTFRRKPSFWDIVDNTSPTELWLAVIGFKNRENPATQPVIRPICIACRNRLPALPSFPVFPTNGGTFDVVIHRVDKPLAVSEELLLLLTQYTDRVFYDVFNKHFEMSHIRYWFVPVKESENYCPSELVDWDALRYTSLAREFVWGSDTPSETFVGRFLIDRVDRSRRFASHGLAPELKVRDPVPYAVAKAQQFKDIQDYSYNAGKKRKWQQIKWDIPNDEPVLFADRLLHRLNYLEMPHARDINSVTAAVICPSPFSASLIPIEVVRSLLIFPSISCRIDAYLHAWDLCKIIKMDDLQLDLALEAITKDSENTHANRDTPINRQSGMGNNYERLEFLGDCYLKLATSVSLFCESHSDDEFKLHVERMILVCNQNLFQKAKIIGIPDYIQTQGFSRRTWYPEMKLIHGKGVGKEAVKNIHTLGDKSVADVCEALIGAALLDRGLDGATKMVSAILQTTKHNQQQFAEYYTAYVKPLYQLTPPTASQQKLADDIEEQFGYRFKSPRLLMSAFTHSSNPYSWEKVPCYQRLEFLGDSLLDLACVRYIFLNYPDADPQWLTEHKMAMVSNRFLGAVSVHLGLHKKLRKMGQQLDTAINYYTVEILEAEEKSSSSNFWSDLSISAPPKALSDILESYIGALFVDSEFDYSLIEQFFDKYIRPYFVDMSLYDDFAGQHPTTFLTKKFTGLGCENWGWELDQYRTETESYVITAIMLHGEVFAFGKGHSAKNARVKASEDALAKLDGMSGEEFAEFCNCREKRAEVSRKV